MTAFQWLGEIATTSQLYPRLTGCRRARHRAWINSPTRSSAVAVIADRTAYRTYGIAAEPNHRLINSYAYR